MYTSPYDVFTACLDSGSNILANHAKYYHTFDCLCPVVNVRNTEQFILETDYLINLAGKILGRP